MPRLMPHRHHADAGTTTQPKPAAAPPAPAAQATAKPAQQLLYTAAGKPRKPIKRGTMRAACVRALRHSGAEGLATGAIFEAIKEQGEVEVTPDSAVRARSHMLSILSTDSYFEKVSVFFSLIIPLSCPDI